MLTLEVIAQRLSRPYHARVPCIRASRDPAHGPCHRPLLVVAHSRTARAVRRTCMTMTAGLSLRPPSRPQARPEPEGKVTFLRALRAAGRQRHAKGHTQRMQTAQSSLQSSMVMSGGE